LVDQALIAFIFHSVEPIIANMKHYMNILGALFFAAGIALLAASCGDDTVNPNDEDKRTIAGVLFYNTDDGTSQCYFRLTEDNAALSDAIVKIGSTVIPSAGGGVYQASSPTITLNPGDAHILRVLSADSTELLSESFLLPDTFSAIVASPANHIYLSSGFVQMDWNGSTGSQGYIATVVRPDSALNAVAYAAYASGVTTAAQIGPEAFQKSDGTEVTGTYDIYILSYRGTFYAWPQIFFPLPSGLKTGNIDTEEFTGTVGVGTLSRGDYLIVTKQQ
jgi:hypothetical protein